MVKEGSSTVGGTRTKRNSYSSSREETRYVFDKVDKACKEDVYWSTKYGVSPERVYSEIVFSEGIEGSILS